MEKWRIAALVTWLVIAILILVFMRGATRPTPPINLMAAFNFLRQGKLTVEKDVSVGTHELTLLIGNAHIEVCYRRCFRHDHCL